MSTILNVLCCQLDIAWEDKAANFSRAGELLDSAGVGEGDLVVLPEMFATGFTMNAAALAEAPGGPTEQFLADLARRKRCWVVGGLAALRADGKPTNDAVTFAPGGGLVGRYSKMHLFSPAQEHLNYQAGTEICLLDLGPLRASFQVCYDLRFPELSRLAVRRGAELLIFLANWPLVREAHWLALLRARAIENQAFVVGVNRCGAGPHNAYGGRSIVIDPRGEALAEAGPGPEVLRAALDGQSLREYRDIFPALRDIRLP